jgi:hypothetical protein
MFYLSYYKAITKLSIQIIAANKNPKQISRFLFTTIYGLRVSSKSNASIKELKDVAAMALSVLN